jgi:hypothetical protein
MRGAFIALANRFGNFAEPIDDGVALAGLQTIIERLRHLEAGHLRAGRFDARNGNDVRFRERVGKRHAA